MKKSFIISTTLVAAAFAAHGETFFDEAQVRSAEPQYESVSVPRQECAVQTVTQVQQVNAPHNYGGAVVGGVAGALLGNQVGRGHGREAATAIGAVVGAFTGDNVANAGATPQYQEVPQQVTSCRTVNDVQTRVTGYRVTWRYHGQNYTTIQREQPGPVMRVRVSVDPA